MRRTGISKQNTFIQPPFNIIFAPTLNAPSTPPQRRTTTNKRNSWHSKRAVSHAPACVSSCLRPDTASPRLMHLKTEAGYTNGVRGRQRPWRPTTPEQNTRGCAQKTSRLGHNERFPGPRIRSEDSQPSNRASYSEAESTMTVSCMSPATFQISAGRVAFGAAIVPAVTAAGPCPPASIFSSPACSMAAFSCLSTLSRRRPPVLARAANTTLPSSRMAREERDSSLRDRDRVFFFCRVVCAARGCGGGARAGGSVSQRGTSSFCDLLCR